MAVKSKTGLAKAEHVPNKRKRTRQGQGKNSIRKSARSRKLYRGQGRI